MSITEMSITKLSFTKMSWIRAMRDFMRKENNILRNAICITRSVFIGPCIYRLPFSFWNLPTKNEKEIRFSYFIFENVPKF